MTVDSMGRVMIPKAWRDEPGLVPGAEIDLSRFGSGVHVEPGSRSARFVREFEHVVVADGEPFTDEQMYALIDAGRR